MILAVDQAAFHTSEKVRVPEGVHLLFLPPKSPELQPAERLWPLTNEAIANRSFTNLDELEAATAHCCRVLLKRHNLGSLRVSYLLPTGFEHTCWRQQIKAFVLLKLSNFDKQSVFLGMNIYISNQFAFVK